MRKGFRILTAVLLSVTLCLPAFAGCGGGGTSDTPGTSAGAMAEYSIDVSSLVLPAAEVQRTYTIKIPRVMSAGRFLGFCTRISHLGVALVMRICILPAAFASVSSFTVGVKK